MSSGRVGLPADAFSDWKQREDIAEKMVPVVGSLFRERGVRCYMFGRMMILRSAIALMKAHRFARQTTGGELSEFETWPILQALAKLDLPPCEVDIGRLSRGWMESQEKNVDAYVKREMQPALALPTAIIDKPKDVVFFGFGRIGRLLTRIMVEDVGAADGLRVRAIVLRHQKNDSASRRASLLRRDSIHGSFSGTIRVDEEQQCLFVNGQRIDIIYASGPGKAPLADYGIEDALLIDNSGVWSDRDGLSKHLETSGVSKVLLTAPAKGDVPNIVYGINHMHPGLINEPIVAAASCTTNAIVPPLRVMHDRFGVTDAHVETVHSYTNDQNLVDNFHPKVRRGRAAPANIVITSTGAVGAVTKILPELSGKMTGNAVRIPTGNVSLAILSLGLERETTKEEVTDLFRHVSLDSPLMEIVEFVQSPEAASSDFNGATFAASVDATATIVDGKRCILYVWYDNEYGYSCQVHRLAQLISGMRYHRYPDPVSLAGMNSS